MCINASSDKFQFHKGTSKTLVCLYLIWMLLRFNSIKVRVKRAGLLSGAGSVMFQFHKGTSKTQTLVLMMVLFMGFNSIKVRVKLFSFCCCCCHICVSIP